MLEHTSQEMERQGRDRLAASLGQADIFILPGHRFRIVDAMVTNFHLPRSTLLMLVSAFVEHGQSSGGPSTGPISSPDASGSTFGRSSGREEVLAAYREAIDHRYRFYSFGDAMMID